MIRFAPRLGAVLLLATFGCGGATVPSGIKELDVSPTDGALARHDTLRIHTTVLNYQNEVLTGIAVGFQSNNTALVSVDAFGLVHSLGPLGSTTITVSAAGLTRTVNVTVFGVPGVFTLTPTDTFIFQDGAVQLTATLLDSGGIVIPGAAVTYTATGPVSVNTTGLVTSLGPAGEARVTATYQPYVVACNVHVIDTALLGRVQAVGHPAAAAVSRTGIALVTRQLAVFLTRITLPAITATTIRVPIGLSGVTFDTTGARAFTLDPRGRVESVDPGAGQLVDSFPVTGVPADAVVSLDDHYLFVATDVDSLFRYDRATLARLGAFGIPARPAGMTRHPANVTLVYIALPDSGLVLEYDVAGDSVRRRLPLGGAPTRIVIAPNGTELYAADRTAGAVHFWDLINNADLASVPVGTAPDDVGRSPDGSLVWVSARGLGRVMAIDRATRTIVRTIVTSGAPRGLAVSPVDGSVVVANDSGWVDVVKP
jgi:hypothetical protein